MYYLDWMQETIAWIEANLARAPSAEAIARKCGLSRFHFARVFRAITGETPAGYAAARRLSEAARRLSGTDAPIAELALDAGYATQQAFSRAFARRLGESPGAVRRDPAAAARALERAVFPPDLGWLAVEDLPLEPDPGHPYRRPDLEENGGFEIVGLKWPSTIRGLQCNLEMPRLRREALARDALRDFPGEPDRSVIWGAFSVPAPDGSFTYVFGHRARARARRLPRGWAALQMPRGRYACFPVEDGPLPARLHLAWRRVRLEWLPPVRLHRSLRGLELEEYRRDPASPSGFRVRILLLPGDEA